MVLVQADSILLTHAFLQVLPHMSVSYFFVLLMILSNTLRQILISMLIRKFLAGTLGDSFLPITKNKKRVQIETSGWIIEMDTLEMLSNKSNSKFLSPCSRVQVLKKQLLVQNQPSTGSPGSPLWLCWASLYFFTDAGLGAMKSQVSPELGASPASSDLIQAAAQGKLWEYLQWVLQALSSAQKVRLLNKHYLLLWQWSHKNISLLHFPLILPKQTWGWKLNQAHTGLGTVYVALKNICFYCCWGAKLRSVQIHYTSNSEETQLQQGSISIWVKNADFFILHWLVRKGNCPSSVSVELFFFSIRFF